VTWIDLLAHPLFYALLLAGGVALGLPMGAAVVSAGALFGGPMGLVIVVLGQAVGLVINWNLCRHWCRDWMLHRFRRRRWRWLLTFSGSCLSWQLLLLLRLALLPMTLVSAGCALSATAWRPYALTSLVLVLRFTLMVQGGAIGVQAITGHLSTASMLLTLTAVLATLVLAWLSAMRLRQLQRRFVSTEP
jgi:uncharacterized membrane protein YdjX (TVP38/TMEM64 family)